MTFFKKIFFEQTDNTFFQLLRYAFVGGIAFIADFGLLYILTEYAHLHYLFSASIAFIAGLIINYFLSKVWVFSASTINNRWLEFFVFSVIGLIGLGINNLALWVFTDYLSLYYMISKIIAAVIVFFWNFLARKFILFKN